MSKSGHQRQSLRLPGYDYAQAGAYFVTICTQGRRCWFGTVINGQMQLSPAGKMLQGWLEKIPTKFPGYCLDVSVIMPNHVHFIVVIDRPTLGITQTAVGTDPCVCPDDCPGEHMGSPLRIPLSRMVQWFKTMTTNHYIRGVRTGICPALINDSGNAPSTNTSSAMNRAGRTCATTSPPIPGAGPKTASLPRAIAESRRICNTYADR